MVSRMLWKIVLGSSVLLLDKKGVAGNYQYNQYSIKKKEPFLS